MSRPGLLILCATLGTEFLACGGGGTSSKDPLDLVPQDSDVSGWTVDQAHSRSPGARAMTASNEEEAVGFIDGGATPFYREPYTPKQFLWQNYVNSTLPAAPPPKGGTVMLYILQMPSRDQASGLYTALLQESDYRRWNGTDQDWRGPTTPPLGTDSRIEDSGTSWWINFYQDVFYIEVQLFPSYGPPPDSTPSDPDLKNEALRFAQGVASRI
jgi:hypothetical protein